MTKDICTWNIDCYLETDGSGYWSKVKAKIHHNKFVLYTFGYKNKQFGELRIFFSTKEWDTDRYGLIYTDRQWLNELKEKLKDVGFSKQAIDDIAYSEQGMQGNDYVSLDVNEDFIKDPKIQTIKTFS